MQASESVSLFAAPQALLGFQKPLTEEYRPQTIADFVGLEKQKKILANLVKQPRPCALLFKGTSGSGKTTMALAFAKALHADVWHIGSQECKVDRLQETVARCHYVPSAGLAAYHVVICDEADCMSDAAQKYLLSKLDSTGTIANTIWIFTCNSTDGLAWIIHDFAGGKRKGALKD
jgi:replication factor C small subunit